MCIDAKIIELLFNDDEFFREVNNNKRLQIGRFPRTDQWCDENGFNLAFALAGFSLEDITVSVGGRVLSISSEKIPSSDLGVIHRGIAKRSFKKSYYLDYVLDTNNIVSTMKDGLLKVTVPIISLEDLKENIIEVSNE